jgi:hypothetical protein
MKQAITSALIIVLTLGAWCLIGFAKVSMEWLNKLSESNPY